MKSKILMAVLVMLFLAAGTAMAIPTANYTVEGNVLNFSVYNDLTDFGISKVGFHVASISDSWQLPTGVQYAASNGYDWFWVDPYVYGVDSISNIKISVSSVPSFVDYYVYFSGQGTYPGTDAVFVGVLDGYNRYRVNGTAAASVPEPLTLIMLGLGLLGMVGLKKKMHK